MNFIAKVLVLLLFAIFPTAGCKQSSVDIPTDSAPSTAPLVGTVLNEPTVISESSLATVVVQMDDESKVQRTLIIAESIRLVIGQKVLVIPYQMQSSKGVVTIAYTIVTK